MKDKICYIKPTSHLHDSGFLTFEVGYILKMDSDNKVKEKQVLFERSDHICQDYMNKIENQYIYCLNFDLTMDGYIRIWSYDGEVVWEDNPMSSAQLNFIPKTK